MAGKAGEPLDDVFDACKLVCLDEGDGCEGVYLYRTKQNQPKCNVLIAVALHNNGEPVGKISDLECYSYLKVRSGTTPTFTLTTTPTTSTTYM